MLPFTSEQFLGVFEQYNLAIWPMHIVAYAAGLAGVVLAVHPVRHGGRIISAILAFFWLWMGAVYHLVFFRQINAAATLFGLLFVLQGIVFLVAGVLRHRLTFSAGLNTASLVGGLFVGYAVVVYPAIGSVLGHGFPQSPSFGVAPCPTTIFTFGLLLWTRGRLPTYVLVIPFLWSLIGASAAVALGIGEDVGLPIAGLLGTAMLVWRDRRIPTGRAGWRQRFA